MSPLPNGFINWMLVALAVLVIIIAIGIFAGWPG